MEKTTYEKAHRLTTQIKGVDHHIKSLVGAQHVVLHPLDNTKDHSPVRISKKSGGTYAVIAEELRSHAYKRLVEYKMALEKQLQAL